MRENFFRLFNWIQKKKNPTQKQFGVVPKVVKENDKDKLIDRKRDKQKSLKEEEKLDKRRAKEDAAKLRKLQDKEKEQEKKMKRKSKQTGKSSDLASGSSGMPEFVQSEKNLIPLFLEQCVEFIEQEGLDSEGIYRVPGNRAHVDLLYQKLQEGSYSVGRPLVYVKEHCVNCNLASISRI